MHAEGRLLVLIYLKIFFRKPFSWCWFVWTLNNPNESSVSLDCWRVHYDALSLSYFPLLSVSTSTLTNSIFSICWSFASPSLSTSLPLGCALWSCVCSQLLWLFIPAVVLRLMEYSCCLWFLVCFFVSRTIHSAKGQRVQMEIVIILK